MNILITGANRGIGLALTELYLGRGDSVVATMRTPHFMAAVNGRSARVLPLEVTDSASADALATSLGDTKLDLLINNAGLGEGYHGLVDTGFDKGEEILRVNAFGPLRVAWALRNHLAAGAKIVNISSRMGSIGDNTSGGATFYRMSKAAQNMATRNMAQHWRTAGVCVAALHPGWVQTEMGGERAPVTPGQSAAGLIRVIDALTLQQSGTFLDYLGETLPW